MSYACDGGHTCSASENAGDDPGWENGGGSSGGGSGSGSGGSGGGSSSGGGSTGGVGGGGVTGPNNGNIPVIILKPYQIFYTETIDLALPAKVHDYIAKVNGIGVDCMGNATRTMKNYGQTNYGSHSGSIKLIDGAGTYYSNGEKVFNEVQRHLSVGKLMIAGVDSKPGNPSENLDGATDHFILISGAGYDSDRKQFYVSYIETARYPGQQEAACSADKNRLYYNSSSGFEGKNYRSVTYKLTHIRPNF